MYCTWKSNKHTEYISNHWSSDQSSKSHIKTQSPDFNLAEKYIIRRSDSSNIISELVYCSNESEYDQLIVKPCSCMLTDIIGTIFSAEHFNHSNRKLLSQLLRRRCCVLRVWPRLCLLIFYINFHANPPEYWLSTNSRDPVDPTVIPTVEPFKRPIYWHNGWS